MGSPGYAGIGCAAHVSFSFGDSAPWKPWVGIGTNWGGRAYDIPYCVDLSGAATLSFRMKGSGSGWYLRAEVQSALVDNKLQLTVDTIPADWTLYTIDFTRDIVADYPVDDPRNWDRARRYVTNVFFQAISEQSGNTGDLWVDDIELTYR